MNSDDCSRSKIIRTVLYCIVYRTYSQSSTLILAILISKGGPHGLHHNLETSLELVLICVLILKLYDFGRGTNGIVLALNCYASKRPVLPRLKS